MFKFNINAQEQYLHLLAKGDVNILRLNDTFNDPNVRTNLFEKDSKVLDKILHFGKDTYNRREEEILKFLNLKLWDWAF